MITLPRRRIGYLLTPWLLRGASAFPPKTNFAVPHQGVAFASPSRVLGMSSFLAMSTSTTDIKSDSSVSNTASNPLLQDWSSEPFALPPFDRIAVNDYKPALEAGMAAHLADLQAIIDDDQPPGFENVISAYDRAGSLLSKVSSVFSNMCSSQNTPELQSVQSELSPILSRHRSKTYALPGLFDKIDDVYQKTKGDSSSLTREQLRLVERIHLDFVRTGGAQLDEESRAELTEIKAELASLRTQFQQNVLHDESNYELVVSLEDLNDCPNSLIEAAKQAATERKKGADDYVITLSRSLVEPFLVFCTNRELRKEAFEAWTKRGQLDSVNRVDDDGKPKMNNIEIATRILKLRQHQAQLYGYKTFAEYQCIDRMAKTPQAVMELLENVWERAKVSANNERQLMEDYLEEVGLALEGGIQPWDWRFVAEKVRKAKYDFDESLLKPYFSLESVREALFSVSDKLFGLKYVPRPDIVAYHPDVDVYEVRDSKENDKLVSIFLHDNYSRAYKGSGAWMSEYRSQTKNLAEGMDSIEGIPIVSNNNNFAKGSGSTLLSYDDAETMFHEMGHAHHGMLSDATYGRLASTNVMTDFVELPSQLLEHWFSEPEVLQAHAKHYETGEPVPTELLEKQKAAQSFQQGFATIEYTICALMDMALHHKVTSYEAEDGFDLLDFEQKELERLGMPQGIVMRHRPPHFLHLFASEMYAAGYYVYLWAEVLDADAYAAFSETGNPFDPEVAEKARKFIYSAGNTEDPQELFRQFRGRDPKLEFMLAKKGLLDV